MSKRVDNFIDKLGGRKFVLVMLVLIMTSLLVVYDKYKDDVFVSIIHLLMITYFSGNVAQQILLDKNSPVPENNDILGGRKFILVILIYLITSVMAWFNELDSTMYIDIVSWIVSIYIAGNVVEKLGTSGFSIGSLVISKKE